MENKKVITLSLDDRTAGLLKSQASTYGFTASGYIRQILFAVSDKPGKLVKDLRGNLMFKD